MLRLSKLTDYGIVVMTFLAREPEQLRTTAEVAHATGVSGPTVSKLLKLLSREQLVRSVRGVKGGYRLAREAAEISVAQIVDALEGPVAVTECSSDESHCEQEANCAIRVNFRQINDAIRSALDGVSLAAMVRPAGSQIVQLTRSAPTQAGRMQTG
jgi:FeS assembly SUF system regulator